MKKLCNLWGTSKAFLLCDAEGAMKKSVSICVICGRKHTDVMKWSVGEVRVLLNDYGDLPETNGGKNNYGL
ncbi:MAG: hypothetical protein RR513_05685 [Muribaculaceae bacterium]